MESFSTHDLYISTHGKDSWSGKLPEPNAERTDGPFATLQGARDAIRELKAAGKLTGPFTVWLRGGRYPITKPVAFEPQDSWPVTYAAYPDETPVIDGGVRIAPATWRTEQVNGTTAWVTEVPFAFRELFVNGQRRSRPRLPKIPAGSDGRDAFYRMERVDNVDFGRSGGITDLFDGYDRFVARAGDFHNWRNLRDVEVVVVHYWIEERMPVASYDEATRTIVSTRHSMFALKDDFVARYAKYYVDNVFEALTEPGEWYLDRAGVSEGAGGRLYYIPLPGEALETTEVYAPRAEQFITFIGNPDTNQYVEHLRFQGLIFEHAGWRELDVNVEPDTGMPVDRHYAASPQAASHVPGAIALEGARYCAFEACTIRHIGYYGIELADGCIGNRIIGCEITDMGAGGVKVNGADASGTLARRSSNHIITDSHIHDGGKVYHSATGVFLKHTGGNTVSHNHIHDLYYSGISSGWVWGYTDSVSKDNRIEKNHIHDLGKAWMSDMGGIYTLSVQPGTVLRGNLIHDIEKANYGGWAIYLDEGSSHVLVENNVCFNTTSQPFNVHYGRENMVRNNVFALGREGQAALGRAESHAAFTFERNIVLTDGQPIFIGGYACDFAVRDGVRNVFSDLNLFWDISGQPVVMTGPRQSGRAQPVPSLSLAQWQARGYDLHSLVADPCFKDAAGGDFTLAPDSPALALGFQPIDLSDVGPREGSGSRE
jgi:hypothetical protein